MGPYLATPNKKKETENGEGAKVRNLVVLIFDRLSSVHVECRAGEILWKIHT